MLSNPKAHLFGLASLGCTHTDRTRENAQTVSSPGVASARLVTLLRLLPNFKPEKYHLDKIKSQTFEAEMVENQ
jgi:hypothetical protein